MANFFPRRSFVRRFPVGSSNLPAMWISVNRRPGTWRKRSMTRSRSHNLSVAWFMHSALTFLVFWSIAFATICAAVGLLGVYSSLINNELDLHTLGGEAAIAGLASFVEAGSVWLVLLLIPMDSRIVAARALFIPALLVAVVYKVAHPEDWSRFELFLLLLFQTVVGSVIACLVSGHFEWALYIVVGFGLAMTVIGGMV